MQRLASILRTRLASVLLCCVACAGLAVPGLGAAAERTVDLELVLAADISESMDPAEAALVRQGFVNALRHPSVIDAIERGRLGRIAITYIEWAGDQFQRTVVGWTEVADAESAGAFAAALEQAAIGLMQYTSISGAIAYAARSFDDNGFRGERVIDVSGDGPNNRGVLVNLARDRAVADGITINGLPILNDRPNRYGYPRLPELDLYYEDCVIGGPGAFMIVAEGFEDFARAILAKMLREIAGRAPPAARFQLAAERVRPPCNIGERQLREWVTGLD
jgi:hypothetical protein